MVLFRLAGELTDRIFFARHMGEIYDAEWQFLCRKFLTIQFLTLNFLNYLFHLVMWHCAFYRKQKMWMERKNANIIRASCLHSDFPAKGLEVSEFWENCSLHSWNIGLYILFLLLIPDFGSSESRSWLVRTLTTLKKKNIINFLYFNSNYIFFSF